MTQQAFFKGSEESGLLQPLLDISLSNMSGPSEGKAKDDLDCFISQKEIMSIFKFETSLQKFFEEQQLRDFMVPSSSPPPEDDDEFLEAEPVSPFLGGSLKNLENFLIRGDLRRCVICNIEYKDVDLSAGNGSNLPRVLYCGDCICENCIVKQIQRASIKDKHDLRKMVAAVQVTCPVCQIKHIFKLTKSGFLVCNDNYIKM